MRPVNGVAQGARSDDFHIAGAHEDPRFEVRIVRDVQVEIERAIGAAGEFLEVVDEGSGTSTACLPVMCRCSAFRAGSTRILMQLYCNTGAYFEDRADEV